MITITTETTISIEKVAKLLQNLVDLQKEAEKGLPIKLQACVSQLLSAQKRFVKQIDNYMHLMNYNVDGIETLKTIAETCPEFLATTDPQGNLPIHCPQVYGESLYSKTFVPLLANIGRRYGVGGEDARGGLLVKNGRSYNVLQCLTDCPSTAVFDALRNAEPPLFYQEDVQNYHLLHEAVSDQNTELVKYMADVDPSCLYHYDHSGNIPIHYICSSGNESQHGNHDEHQCKGKFIAEWLLQKAVSQDTSNPTIGGLFTTEEQNEYDLVLNCLINRFGETDAWDCIERALSSFDNLPILHQVIQHAPQHCATVMRRFPDSVVVRDCNNRLPIHVALDNGMNWSTELVAIINSNRQQLKEVDPVTKWPPFALAGKDGNCDLRTIYHLIRKNPEHVELADNSSNRSFPMQCTKRRKIN
jgi:hypothetical protein